VDCFFQQRMRLLIGSGLRQTIAIGGGRKEIAITQIIT
jgi:hypothetical protein